MNLRDIASKVKGYIQSKTQDDEGWIRQGNFTPVQQVKTIQSASPIGAFGLPNLKNQQVQQNFKTGANNLQQWGNIAKQGISNQIDIQKRDLNKFVYQPLKENPFLTPTLNRFEQAVPSIKNQLKYSFKRNISPLNPFQSQENRLSNMKDVSNYRQGGQAWQDTKNIASAGLTAFGLAKLPVAAVVGGAVINPLIKLGTNIYENKKGEELNNQLRQSGQLPQYTNKRITEGVVNAIPEGAGTGLANAGTTRLTNYMVQSLSNLIPVLKPLTEKAIKEGSPVITDNIKQGIQKFFNTAGKRLMKAAVVETAVETPIWATLTQTEQETYLDALQREAVENLIMNVGMAGVQSLGDARSLTPIIKKSIDDTVTNYFKNASTPEAISKQGGYIDMFGNIKDGTARTRDFYTNAAKWFDPTATEQERIEGLNGVEQIARKLFSAREYKQLTIRQNPEVLIQATARKIKADVEMNVGYQEPVNIPNFKDWAKSEQGGIDLTDTSKPFPQQPIKTGGDINYSETLKKDYTNAEKEFIRITGTKPEKIQDLTEFKVTGKIPYGYKGYSGPIFNEKTLKFEKSSQLSPESESPIKTGTPEVKGKYKTINQGGVIKEIEGKPVDIHKELSTILNKDENGNWVVTETTTGRALSGGGFPSESQAIRYTNDLINSLGIDKVKQRISELPPIKTGEVPPLSPESKGIKIKPNDDLVTKFDETIKVGEQPKIKVTGNNKLPWEEKGYDFGEAIYGGNKPPRPPKSDSIKVTGEEADTAMNFAELKASEDPKAFDNIFSNWIGKRESSKTKATVEASKFTNIPGNPEDIIKSVEGSKVNLTPEQQTYSAELRKTYDNLFEQAKKEGVDMNYLENYLTHIWDKPLNQVAQDYKTAKQTFKFAGERQLPTYEQGIKMGLKPKYTNPAQILEDYTRRLNETFANMELFKNLKNEGLIVGGSKVSGNPNFAPINAPGFPRAKFNIGEQGSVISNWYAPKNIANQINKIFTPQDYGTIGKIAKVGSDISGKVQDITLSGGIPKTPVNAWTIAQTTKEVLSGRIKSPLTSIFRSLSEKSSNKFFQENAGQIVKMQENNVPMNTSFNVENLIDKGTARNLFGDNVGSAWNKIVNEPTFKRFMPQLQINLFNDIEKSLLKKGVSSTDATKQAAQAVKNFYGLVDTSNMAKRDKLGQNIISSVFFAPRYRESMINFWVNNLKALKNPISPENITNTKFTIGAILSFVTMNAINKANTGNNMWENPTGKEDKMLVKTKDGYVGVPFLSSIATMPRLAAKAVGHLIQGNLPEVTKDVKGTLSSSIRPMIDVFNNEDYFGGQIYDPDKSTKWGDIGLYLAGQYNHPYIREALNVAAQSLSPEVKKKLGLNKQSVPAYQTFSKAMELPFRFYNNKVNKGGTGTTDVLETARYYESKDEATKELSSDQKKLYDAMEQKRPDDISQASDIQMNMAEALQLLANPAILRAKAKTAIDTATKTGQALDPFYTLDKDQQLVVLRLKTFYPGDKEKTNITNENIDWLKPYWTARSAYFDELESKGVIAKQEESEEFATPEMQKKLDYYYTLPYGTGARTAYINQNPDLVEYWDKKRAITNEKRAELGLTEQVGFTAYAKKPKKITAKIIKITSPKANIKFSSPRASKFKLKPSPKIKITKTDNRKYTIKA